TSGKQGPWTDIYGLSATLYHAITGETPPNAIDRMLDDGYRPLIQRAPSGYRQGVLAGVDAGLAVRAIDRPQTIAGWRPLLARTTGPEADDGTVAVGQPPRPSSPRAARRLPLWAGAAAGAAAALLAAGGFLVAESLKPSPPSTPDRAVVAKAVEDPK